MFCAFTRPRYQVSVYIGPLVSEMSSIVSEFGDLRLYDKFLYIMSLRKMDVISLVLLYVDNCFNLRQRYYDSSQLAST